MPAMRVLACLVLAAAAFLAAPQNQTPAPYTPTSAEKGRIESKLAELSGAMRGLEQNPLHADVAIYRKAAEFILAHPEEFATQQYVADTLAALDKGMARARELAAGRPGWPAAKGRLVRAYVSAVDGSVQ